MNEVITYEEGSVPAIADDTLLAIAKMAEARIDAVIKIKQLALKVTNGLDWTDQGGKPYLQASGAEKIANLFNISWGFLTPEPLYEEEADGHYTYTFKGRFSMGGRTIEVEGSRSSRDPFFTQYRYEDGPNGSRTKTEKAVHERDNKRDVKMAALTNLLGNGITRLLGIRNLSYQDLEAFAGITKDQIGKVNYKSGGEKKEEVKQPQKKGEQKIASPITATIKDVQSKSGEKNGKPYTIYTIFDENGNKFGTFSDTFADLASSAKNSGQQVTITFNTDQYGHKITDLVLVEREPGSDDQ